MLRRNTDLNISKYEPQDKVPSLHNIVHQLEVYMKYPLSVHSLGNSTQLSHFNSNSQVSSDLAVPALGFPAQSMAFYYSIKPTPLNRRWPVSLLQLLCENF